MTPKEVNKEIAYTVSYYIDEIFYKGFDGSIQGFWLELNSKYDFCSYQSMLNKMSGKTSFTPYELSCIEDTLNLPYGYIMNQSILDE